MVLNPQTGDNESLRDGADIVHHCYRDRSVTVNPIVDWTDSDVWEFLHHYGCESNPLYQCGEERIGCVGCPLSGSRRQKSDFIKYPKYRKNYVAAFERMLKRREELGKENRINWQTGEDVMRWWLGEDINQITMFDEEEMLGILQDMGG